MLVKLTDEISDDEEELLTDEMMDPETALTKLEAVRRAGINPDGELRFILYESDLGWLAAAAGALREQIANADGKTEERRRKENEIRSYCENTACVKCSQYSRPYCEDPERLTEDEINAEYKALIETEAQNG